MSKNQDRANQVAQRILEAFEAGSVPAALAPVFLVRQYPEVPANRWSYSNRLLLALQGHIDGRGFQQWKQVGRTVKKGEKANHILAPLTGKRQPEDGETPTNPDGTVSYVYGFKAIPVFGVDQTEGKVLPYLKEETRFFDSLPVVDVARAWGLDVQLLADSSQALGQYRHGRSIELAVKNLRVWAHELIHAADDRRGTITTKRGQQLDNEVVADLGGAVLLECLGHTVESDRGAVWRYICRYCEEHKREPLPICKALTERACAAVALVLDTSAQVERVARNGVQRKSAQTFLAACTFSTCRPCLN